MIYEEITTEVKMVEDRCGVREPAWITSNLKDLWGRVYLGNCAFFDFDGNKIKGMEYRQPTIKVIAVLIKSEF